MHRLKRLAAIAGAFAAHGTTQLAMLHAMLLAFGGANLAGPDARFHLRPRNLDILRGALTMRREAAAHTSAQSRQTRMHWRMSIFSATHASAQDVQNREQSMA